MKKAILLALGMLCTLAATAQDQSGFIEAAKKHVTAQHNISSYSKLYVNGPFDVILVKDKADALTIEGAENIVPLITAEVKDQVLTIAIKDGLKIKPSKHNRILIKVPFNALNEVSLYGSGSITSKKTIDTNLGIKLNGSGSIKLSLHSPKTDVNMVGSGSVTLTGYSESIACKLTGSGTIMAKELQSDAADVVLMGSGTIKVATNKSIKGRINGGGSVAFGGEPEKQDLMREGTGEFSAF
ncbi:head GIN domain-containing protein [Flavobacterium psychrotrophum]|uniref:head GIN domain-containing protein n=1 Tax=Flavobacterium psychrotrophum TaxID=2294119 RepID=UPI000E30C6F4|nr:head GIN domain-containing protein [Flavobacterium psychrotrophum]